MTKASEPERPVNVSFLETTGCKIYQGKNDSIRKALTKKAVLRDTEMKNDTNIFATYSFDLTTGEGIISRVGYTTQCCPDSVYSATSIENDIINIQSKSKDGDAQCDCICDYDIHTKLTNIKAQVYNIILDGVAFEIDLTKETSGTIYKEGK